MTSESRATHGDGRAGIGRGRSGPSTAPEQDPVTASAGPDGYWARRLGNRPRQPESAPAPPPSSDTSPADGPAGTAAPAAPAAPPAPAAPAAPAADPSTVRAAALRPPASFLPHATRFDERAFYGPCRAHDPVKNWIIGGVAAVLLIAAAVGGALSEKSSVTNVFASITELPSSGSNTVAWYWSTQLGSTAATARPLNVANSDFSTIVTSVQDGGLAYFVALDRHGDAWMWGRSTVGPVPFLQVSEQPTAVTMPSGVHFTSLRRPTGTSWRSTSTVASGLGATATSPASPEWERPRWEPRRPSCRTRWPWPTRVEPPTRRSP